MTDEPTDKPPAFDYMAFWGDDTKLRQAKMAPRGSITIPDRFLRGPLQSIVERSRGAAGPDEVKAFCDDALMAWYDKYRDRRAGAGAERQEEIRALVPPPGEGELANRIDVNLEGRIKEEAFGRVLGIRFKTNAEGRSLAIREAILEALVAARGGQGRESDG